MNWVRRHWIALIIVVENTVLLTVWGVYQWRSSKISSVEKGKQIAERLGCFTCHGPGGTKGIQFANRPEWDAPSWDGGTAMMYVQSEKEIAEWILYGAPKRLREDKNYQHQQQRRLVRMPSYRHCLNDQELHDLIDYWKTVAEWQMPPSDSQVAKGYEVAKKSGCFSCHGPAGRGSPPNPGSFKGYIPGWDSSDFDDLVRDEPELEQWILDGISQRFRKNPAAKFFLQRAPIKMPAYRNYLTSQQLEQLKSYIRWLSSRVNSSKDVPH